MSWHEDLKTPRFKGDASSQSVAKVPEGLWTKCPKCGEISQARVLEESLNVCPDCQHHMRITAEERVNLLCDGGYAGGKFKPYAEDLKSNDPLNFEDRVNYKEKLEQTSKKLKMGDAMLCGKATLGIYSYHLGVFEFKFMGGSMGVAVGEKISLVFENALKDKIPAVIVSASGGARMQEGILSLMQMAKTSALIQKMRDQGIPYISVLTDPTTGGVAASFAMLGDVIFAEPNALIGFAGPRVIEQTIRQTLPPGFQRSEFLLKHGFIDRIVQRKDLAKEITECFERFGNRCDFRKKK